MREHPTYTGAFFPGRDHLHHDIYPSISPRQTPSLKQPGKVVLITGSGRGIGRAIALQYAHASVAALILVARTSSQLDEVESSILKINPSIRVHKYSLDVTNDAAVAHCASGVIEKEGRLDVLINNAGSGSPWVPIEESDTARYWGSLTINVKGPYLFCHAFLPLLQKTAREQGTTSTVVNITSIGSQQVFPTTSEYGIGKIALNRLTEFVGVENAEKGVQAFAVHPGGVDTSMTKSDETFVKGLDGCKFSDNRLEAIY